MEKKILVCKPLTEEELERIDTWLGYSSRSS
jgi:hypothetical protein